MRRYYAISFYCCYISVHGTVDSFYPSSHLFFQEKQEKTEEYRRNCIQCVMGPEGTVVTFPDKMGLPSIFDSKPIRLHIVPHLCIF